ncbi:MAG: hypothetical protein KGL46_12570 [Hyphomicrobiales bacterium]|nr:hypothetical protein [Hyphomicrobiales bacterium]
MAKNPSAKQSVLEEKEIPFAYTSKSETLAYIMRKLAALNEGKSIDLDFVSAADVGKFCKLFGFEQNWAAHTINEICKTSKYGPHIAHEGDSRIVLDIIRDMIKRGVFVGTNEQRFDKTILNDFLPKSRTGFQDKPTLGHFWEWRYALQVELEHGRTRGTNVTNNHPLLTALIVMAHLTEDSLYYARLWVMETSGEISKSARQGAGALSDLGAVAKENHTAQCYLAKRLHEKAQMDGVDLPE